MPLSFDGEATVLEVLLAAEARERFFERQLIFAYRHGSAGRLIHALAWLVHNCLARLDLDARIEHWTIGSSCNANGSRVRAACGFAGELCSR